MKPNNNIPQLESLFFSTLDALRGVWRTPNAISVLFSLFFFKRVLALHREEQIKLTTDDKIDNWATYFKKQVVINQSKATQELLGTFASFSKQNRHFQHIFIPFILALEEEKNSQHLIQIILMLDEMDFSSDSISIEEFGNFFNTTLYKVALQVGKKGRKHSTPRAINQLLVALAKPQDNEVIYDPAVGQGSLLVELAKEAFGIELMGQEQELHAWALAKMNLIANGLYYTKIVQGNSLTTDVFAEQKADIAVAHFPFGAYLPTTKIKNQPYLMIPFDVGIPKVYGNNLFVQLLLSKLNNRGRMLTILPIQALTADKDDRKLREFLIRRDWIEAIITLPYGLLQTTRVPVCILIVNKEKKADRQEHIVFVNGVNLQVEATSKLQRRITAEQIECLAKAYHNLDMDCSPELQNCIARVPLHKIILNDYNLDAKSYASPFISRLQKLEDLGQLIQLKSIFKPDAPSLWFDAAPNESLAYVRVEDLGYSISNFQIHTDKVTKADDVQQIVGQLVSESVLMVNRTGQKLQLGYFEFEGIPILINENILIFRIDTERVNIEYLAIQLFDDLFLQQLEMYKQDYQSISEEQFEGLKINLPTLKEQNNIVKTKKLELLQAEEQKVEQLRYDLNIGRQKAQNEQYKIISSLQHELGNQLPAVLTEFKNLKDYLRDKAEDESNISFYEPIYPVFEGEDVEDIDKLHNVLERIESILIHSINTLDATSNIIQADSSKLNLERTNIKVLLEAIQQVYKNNQNFDILIEVDEDGTGNELQIETHLDRTQITTAISNLIENAIRHGFVDSTKTYTILFQVGIAPSQQELILVYKNDGKPFPRHFSFDDFISYGNYAGSTGHSGIGGFLVNQIIQNHNGQLNYRTNVNPHNPFKVQFEITLPIIK